MFKLPDLPYDYSALEPHIDAKTMEIHHSKHHQGYVDNLNKAINDLNDVEKEDVNTLLKNLSSVPEDKKQTVINNAGGHSNHSLFWETMIPTKDFAKPSGSLTLFFEENFNGFDNFRKEFTDKALSLFGSGWVFLLKGNDGYSIKRHSFQNSPFMYGNLPVFGLDVWEHAYYLKYQNKRAEYVENWWNVVNWKKIEERL